MTSSDAETDFKLIMTSSSPTSWRRTFYTDLFNNYRPDIAVADSNSICTVELTVCHETNVVSSRDYKREYQNIADFRSTLAGNRKVYSHTIEIYLDLSLTLMILPS